MANAPINVILIFARSIAVFHARVDRRLVLLEYRITALRNVIVSLRAMRYNVEYDYDFQTRGVRTAKSSIRLSQERSR